MIKCISNLYPYPAQPLRGLFNLQLFRELARLTEIEIQVPVAAANPLAMRRIRHWQAPAGTLPASYFPYRHLPLIGRNFSSRFVSLALSGASPGQAENPQAVLASWLYPDGTAAAELYRTNNVPVWVMVLGTDRFQLRQPRRRRLVLQAEPHTAGYICVSQNIADDITAAGLPAEKVVVIANGVDTELFRRDNALQTDAAISKLEQTAGLPPQALNGGFILWIGNMVAVKGPDIALSAFAGFAANDNRRLPLIMIGDGPMLKRLRQTAERLGISGKVHFTGRRPHAELPRWLNSAACLMLSSRSEGMPNAVIEALACGCPVAATDVGNCRELLSSQPAAAIAKAEEPADLARAVAEVVRQSIRSDSRPVFSRTWGDMAREILALMHGGDS